MGRIEDRWDRRADTYRDGREPFTAQAAAMIRATPQEVWDFLDAPGSRVLLDPKHLKTFPVPGTPDRGVGHQFCTLRLREGDWLTATVYEVIEHEPPRRGVRRLLNATAPYVESIVTAEVPGGCSLALNVGTRIPVGDRRSGQAIQTSLNECVAKVKTFVEALARE